MAELEILRWIVTGIMGVAVWFVKRTIDSYDEKLKEQDKQFTQFMKELAEIRRDYLHRDDFKEFKLELRGMFEELKVDIKEIKQRHEKN